MKKKQMLDKLKMPAAASDEADMEGMEEEAPEMEASESEEHEMAETPDEESAEHAGEAGPLEAASDEELMAELKKRGLSKQLEAGEEDEYSVMA